MPHDPFVVHVARLRRVAGTRWHEVRRGPVDLDHPSAPGPGGRPVPDHGPAGSTRGSAAGSTRAAVDSTRTTAGSTRATAGSTRTTAGSTRTTAGSTRAAVDSTVPEGAEACCDVVLQSFDGGVMATGTVAAPWQGVCRRCTVAVGGELRVAVRERFTEPGPRYGDPDDDDAYPIVDDQLDLGPMVRDAVVLELPLAPLCRDDCRGLCPHCGADRNVEQCGCVAPVDPRWANLDVLRSAR